jgi:4-amino-4-deoxy-L-arabinose transferase-like glycosyltransferase
MNIPATENDPASCDLRSAVDTEAGCQMQDAAPGPRTFPAMRPVPLFALIVLYAAAIYLPFLGSSRTLTRHEVIIAWPALDVLRDGNWLVPDYADEIWVDKPPLVTWATSLLFHQFGFSEYTARLPAALSAIGLCLLAAIVACRYFGSHAALWAGFIQATSIYMYMQGRLGEIDMPFTLILAGAHLSLLWYWGTGRTDLPLPAAAAFHVLAGLAVLAKGPLGVGLLGASILVFCGLRRSIRPLISVLWTPAIVLFPIVGLSWYVAVWFSIGDLAWDRWYYSNVDRFAGAHVQGAQSALLYLSAIPWMVLPWGIALLVRLPRVLGEALKRENHVQRYLWAWFIGGMIVLFCSAMKHKHYAIPMLVPLTILVAKLFAEDMPRYPMHVRRLAAGGLVAALLVFAVVSGVVMPLRDHRAPTVEFLRQETAQVPADEPLYVVGLAQSAVYPYIQHAWKGTHRFEELRQALDNADGPVWVLTLHEHLDMGEKQGIAFETVAAEPVRRKYPKHETLVLGRISHMPAAGAPAAESPER